MPTNRMEPAPGTTNPTDSHEQEECESTEISQAMGDEHPPFSGLLDQLAHSTRGTCWEQ